MSIASSALNDGDETVGPRQPTSFDLSDPPHGAAEYPADAAEPASPGEAATRSIDPPGVEPAVIAAGGSVTEHAAVVTALTAEPAVTAPVEAEASAAVVDELQTSPPLSTSNWGATDQHSLETAEPAERAEPQPIAQTAMGATIERPLTLEFEPRDTDAPPSTVEPPAESHSSTLAQPAIELHQQAAEPLLHETAFGEQTETRAPPASFDTLPATQRAEPDSPPDQAPLNETFPIAGADEPATADASANATVRASPPPIPRNPPRLDTGEGPRSLASALDTVPPLQLAPDLGSGRPEPSFAPTLLGTTSAQSPAAQPLASAFGAAAKLAADATAAAEALENLKRLLERQLPHPAQSPRPPVHELFAEPAKAHAPPALPRQDPPPLQTAAAEMEDDDDRLPPAPAKPVPRAKAKSVPWRERRQFDFRGFMAGFAISWAIGAVLYIYLTAG